MLPTVMGQLALGLTSIAISQALVCILLVRQVLALKATREIVMSLLEDLRAIKDQLSRARDEIVDRISGLETALAAAGTVDPEVVAALESIKATAQALDDIVPDEAVNPVQPAEPAVSDGETDN